MANSASWALRSFGRTLLKKHKLVLVSWSTDPRYIPPFFLSKWQVTVGPKIHPNQPLAPYDGFTPIGRFDLFSALQRLHLSTKYDLIVCDGTRENHPTNLAAFDCPKVLLVCDTHHLSTLQNAIDYAATANYDFILITYNRQHAHWFIDAGFKRIAWLPGIAVRRQRRSFGAHRHERVCFFGNAGKYHFRRAHLIEELRRRGDFPLVTQTGKPETGAELYANTAVSLNCSLNGDFNLRVFEILGAGGCLLTDRLSPEAGLSLILEEGKEFLGYDTVDECLDQARFLLAHPEEALNMARSGFNAFSARLAPEHRIEQLFQWVFEDRLDSQFRVDLPPCAENEDAGKVVALADRIRIYDQLQEIHRVCLTPSILFTEDVPEIHIQDALDLRHLRISVVDKGDGSIRTRSPEILQRCGLVGRAEAAATSWDAVIALPRDEQEPLQSVL